MSLQNNYNGILPHENDILEGLARDGYFKAIDVAKLSKVKFVETLIRFQEGERKKLAHELHDSVNTSLTIAKLYLGLLTANTQKEKHAKEQLALIIALTEQNIRTISNEMIVSQDTEAALCELIGNLITHVKALNKFTLSFKCTDKEQLNGLPFYQKIALFRIVQEQVDNVIKHSGASKVSIHLSCVDDCVKFIKLTIKDNGVGFDTSLPVNGIGLSIIRNRVKHLKGYSKIKSAPGKGCMVEVCVPVSE